MKGLLKGFWWPFRLLKLVKYSQSYALNEVCDKGVGLTVLFGVDGYLEHYLAKYSLIKGLKVNQIVAYRIV